MIKEGPIKRDLDLSADFRIQTARFKFHSRKISSREIVATALYEIASEHHSAIGLLLRFQRFSSAQALVRSCVETSLRVVWVLRCASEEQIESIKNKKTKWPELEQIIGSIEGVHKRGGFIRKLLPPRTLLNELTHGGFALIADRLLPLVAKTNPQVVNQESMQEQIAAFCIRASDRMLLLACAVMHIDLGDPNAADLLSISYQKIVKSYEIGRIA